MMNIVAVLIYLVSAVFASDQDAYKKLAEAVEEGRHLAVASILQDPSVDPSFDDHRLIRDSECRFGAKTTRLLLRDHRFDPGANDNCFLKKAFKAGNIFIVMLLLAHPKVDPHSIDDICGSNGDQCDELRELMRTLNGRHLAVREGKPLVSTDALTEHAYLTLLFSALFNGREDHMRRLIQISDQSRPYMPFDLALYLDHPGIGRLALELEPRFKLRMTSLPVLSAFVCRLRRWKASRSLEFALEQILLMDESLNLFLAQLFDPENISKNQIADKLYLHALSVYSGEDVLEILAYLIHLASTAIFRHYVALPHGLRIDLSDLIIRMCL